MNLTHYTVGISGDLNGSSDVFKHSASFSAVVMKFPACFDNYGPNRDAPHEVQSWLITECYCSSSTVHLSAHPALNTDQRLCIY